MAKATIGKGVKTKTTWANALKRDWQLYLLLMIPVALVVIFNYASYGGIRMVFMDYKPAKGYAGSKWVGWATFQKVFKDKDFIRALKSSIVFNLLDLAVGFPMPIILALILNELRFPRFKKVTQTILYLPHFLSWVIVGSVAYQMFRPTTGMVNVFLMNAGIIQNGIPFLTEKWHWAVTYLLIGVWQGMVPFTYLLENGGGEPEAEELDWTVEQLSVGLMGNGEVEVKAVLAFNCFQKEPVMVQNIESAKFTPMSTEELENRPGIVGYFVKNGDTLWNLAKKYNTTVENIKEVNHMEKEDVNKGDKILIFKQNLSIL